MQISLRFVSEFLNVNGNLQRRATGQRGEALANAVPSMQALGHTVLAWIWPDVALASLKLDATESIAETLGWMGEKRYFYRYELPKIGAWPKVVETRDAICAELPEEAF